MIRFTKQLVTKVRPAAHERVVRLHAEYGLSQAEVIRLAIDAGLPAVERMLIKQAETDRRVVAA